MAYKDVIKADAIYDMDIAHVRQLNDRLITQLKAEQEALEQAQAKRASASKQRTGRRSY